MAVKIPADLQEFLKGKQGWVATASKSGVPNVSIKGTLRMLDDQHLIFADLFSMKTRKNLSENPVAAIMVFEAESKRGYMFKGATEQIASGPLYDEMVQGLKKAMPQLPAPKYVVNITIESIWDQSSGPNGGKQIA